MQKRTVFCMGAVENGAMLTTYLLIFTQDLVSGGHNKRSAEGASIEAPKAPSGVGMGRGVHFTADAS